MIRWRRRRKYHPSDEELRTLIHAARPRALSEYPGGALARRVAELEEYVTDMDSHIAELDAMVREFYGVAPVHGPVPNIAPPIQGGPRRGS